MRAHSGHPLVSSCIPPLLLLSHPTPPPRRHPPRPPTPAGVVSTLRADAIEMGRDHAGRFSGMVYVRMRTASDLTLALRRQSEYLCGRQVILQRLVSALRCGRRPLTRPACVAAVPARGDPHPARALRPLTSLRPLTYSHVPPPSRPGPWNAQHFPCGRGAGGQGDDRAPRAIRPRRARRECDSPLQARCRASPLAER